ncbi:TPA: hypothetical protein NEG48_003081 [Elizabethkingia anophelis]|nr:hypothetical protein [Elizabethkingia anophelis]
MLKLFSKSRPSLSTAQIIHPKSGHLVEGYPIIIKNKEGGDSLWMLRIGSHIQEIEANNLLFMYFLSEKNVESRLFKVKAKSITTSEWVTGYPFYAKGETRQNSYWLIKENCATEEILTDGLIGILPESIIYEKF